MRPMIVRMKSIWRDPEEKFYYEVMDLIIDEELWIM